MSSCLKIIPQSNAFWKIDRERIPQKSEESPAFVLHDAFSSLYPFFGKDGLAMPFTCLINSYLSSHFPHLSQKMGKMG
jgi:hypothetical protein